MSTNNNEEILLGIDYGERNIGLAFGRNGFATPLHTISGANTEEAIKEISRFCIESKITKIIIGLPLTADNKETKKSHEIRRFAKRLKIVLKKPLEYVNEYQTTKDAIEGAIEMGVSQKSRRTVDHIAAALILKQYYNNHR